MNYIITAFIVIAYMVDGSSSSVVDAVALVVLVLLYNAIYI